MENGGHCYQIIREILARNSEQPGGRERIKSEIINAIGPRDYISAVIDYLWGAYYHFDCSAKESFQKVFAADLKEQKPDVFQFFSFFFSSEAPRRGFDRRLDSDRREGYLLDLEGNIIERRSGRERRAGKEKRTEWTRITEWVSVPFKRQEGGAGAGTPPSAESLFATDAERRPEMNLRSLGVILSALITYYETYIQTGRTAWREQVDRETFERARRILGILMEIPTDGWPVDAEQEPSPAGNLLEPKGQTSRK